MNAEHQTKDIITRIMNLKEFEVKRMLDEPLAFTGGPIPFDIRANHECAWFKVLAVSQKEAEIMVDEWIERKDLEN
jgi:hypothetical protein